MPYETAAAIPVDFDLTGRVFIVHPVGVLLKTTPEIMKAIEELDCEGVLKKYGPHDIGCYSACMCG